ncbi:hypothetical protein AADZ90_000895 [Aestuariibius sp. 2305UL40-4]|uniref:hypothetical protein n=1 Tax=Aestuariibius violaceus TaxID=3234132 RepID=UPI00345E7B1B
MRNLLLCTLPLLFLGLKATGEDTASHSVTVDMTTDGGGFFDSETARINFMVLNDFEPHQSGADIAYFTFNNQVFSRGEDGYVSAISETIPLETRVDLAGRAIDLHPDCTWVGFDPDYHQKHAGDFLETGMTSDMSRILFVQVQC